MHVLTTIRSYLELSQTALAKRAGVTQPDLSEMETLAPYGKIGKYQRLSDCLGIPVEAIAKNDYTSIPLSFFDAHPAPAYTPEPTTPDLLLGRQGEEFILRREQARLAESQPALAKLVLPHFKMKCPSPGYDILSFDDAGHPIYLEVKTSLLDSGCFRFTNHELDAARKLTAAGERYVVCYISRWGEPNQQVREYLFPDLSLTHQIEPRYYMCKPIPKKKRRLITGLAYFRKKQGLRQADVSEALGVHACEWSMYETGQRTPSIQVYIRASELLGATVDQLLERYEALPTESEAACG